MASKLEEIVKHDMEWIKQNPNEVYNIMKKYRRGKDEKPYSEAHIKNNLTLILTQFKEVESLELEKSRQIYRAFHREVQRSMKGTKEVSSEGNTLPKLTWQEVLDKREELNKSEYGSKRHLLLNLLTRFDSSLNNFLDITILSKSPTPKEKKKYVENVGYLVLNKRVFKLFQNVNAVKVSKELQQIIRKSLEIQPRSHLITDTEGSIYSSTSYTYFCNSALKEIFKREDVCVTTLKDLRALQTTT